MNATATQQADPIEQDEQIAREWLARMTPSPTLPLEPTMTTKTARLVRYGDRDYYSVRFFTLDHDGYRTWRRCSGTAGQCIRFCAKWGVEALDPADTTQRATTAS